MFDLTGKRALVTGASGGIGRQVAKALGAAGAEVTLSGTREGALGEVAAEMESKTHILPANLADLEAVDKLVPDAVEAMGGLEILVNNAGMTRDNIFMRMKDEDWDDVIAVNLTAAFRLARAAVRPMVKARFGRIVNMSSVVGVAGNPGQANYCATKAGIIGMGKSIAQEVASRNITVNAIAPGYVESAMTDALSEKQRDSIMVKVPANRWGKSTEIAAAVVFLASEEAGYITGHTLNINGGMLMI